MVETRRSLGTPSNHNDASRKRRNSFSPMKTHKKLYPDLTEGVSYMTTTSTVLQQTSEVADDDDIYETDQDSSFASSNSSGSRKGRNSAEKSRDDILKLGIAVVFVILLAVTAAYLLKGRQSNKNDPAYENYIKSIRTLINSNYQEISKENREILRLIGRKLYLEPENHAPLVILVGGARSQSFSEEIDKIINGKKNPPIRVQSGVYRADLHENLRRALTSSGSSSSSEPLPHSAVVLDVDLLEWDAVLVLHAFADHENFPIPKTVLFLTVSEEEISRNIENCDAEMVGFLTKRWIKNGGSSDNIPPIIARISYFLCV